MTSHSIQDVVKKGLCISCGACTVVAPENAIRMVYKPRQGIYLPKIIDPERITGKGVEFDVCPGKGYPILALARHFGNEGYNSDLECGMWENIWACHSTNPQFLKNAASGGIMTAIAHHLIVSGRVSGALVTKMEYGCNGPRPNTFIAQSIEELVEAQGSKYCPVSALSFLPSAKKFEGQLVFVGTPCQIAALRLLQQIQPEWGKKIPYAIGSFCGGFRDFRETDTLICRAGIAPDKVTYFRYRGGGQPGSMLIEDDLGRSRQIKYPHYTSMTGYTKHKRCRFCVDATAELSDFSCGDAWLPRFIESSSSWSLLFIRSTEAERIIEEMRSENKLQFEEVTLSEIKQSQYHNILSKKKRQHGRRRLMKLLGIDTPEFDGGYYTERSNLFLEMRVHLRHLILYAFEKIGLYPSLYKLVKKLRGK